MFLPTTIGIADNSEREAIASANECVGATEPFQEAAKVRASIGVFTCTVCTYVMQYCCGVDYCTTVMHGYAQ